VPFGEGFGAAGRILGGQPQHQPADLDRHRWTPTPTWPVGPSSANGLAVPAQQRGPGSRRTPASEHAIATVTPDFPVAGARQARLRRHHRPAQCRQEAGRSFVNAKYTGYMVYNRRASTSAGGKVKPPSTWLWSDHPTHEPLITREMYDTAQATAHLPKGNTEHRLTQPAPRNPRRLPLRSYVWCAPCERRMFGQTERRERRVPCAYLCCRPDHNHKGRHDRFPVTRSSCASARTSCCRRCVPSSPNGFS
jgi:hypothetical protein